MSEFRLPDLGEGLEEAEIVQWHVAPGDHVVADQPLLAVETEKAVVEIPSPRSGYVEKLLIAVGQRAKVGTALLLFQDGAPAQTGTVVGELPIGEARHAPVQSIAQVSTVPVPASPAVRAKAKALGVDLAHIAPSGPNGTVTLADLEKAGGNAGHDSDALRGARRTMALNMARAWREVAHATLQDHADVHPWQSLLGVTERLIRATVAACAQCPEVNAHYDAGTQALHRNPHVDLGLAIDGPDGLFVPVLRSVDKSDAKAWRQQIDAAKQKVAQRSLLPADLRAPTITLSNFGTIAGRHAALIVMPPQVAIIGAGRITEQPVRNGDGVAFHPMLPVSISFDHRALSGGTVARFLRVFIADLERPA
jgi:pyruvate dehydrogenase E2 component (dihydrolipoamide acetyltransferase)